MVILSELAVSRSEAAAQSMDPYIGQAPCSYVLVRLHVTHSIVALGVL